MAVYGVVACGKKREKEKVMKGLYVFRIVRSVVMYGSVCVFVFLGLEKPVLLKFLICAGIFLLVEGVSYIKWLCLKSICKPVEEKDWDLDGNV